MISGTTVDGVAPAQGPGMRTPGPRRAVIAAVVLTVVVAGLAGLLTVRHLDRSYGPIEPGNSGGPFTQHNIDSGGDGSTLSLSTAPGATARMYELIDNEGAHSVTITSIPTDAIATDIRWSTYQVTGNHDLSGDPEPWHRFPAVVPGHGTIRLLVTIHRPADCTPATVRSAGETLYTGYHVVHWQSLLQDHTSVVEYPAEYSVRVC